MNNKNNNILLVFAFAFVAFFFSSSVFANTEGHKDTIDSILNMGVNFDPSDPNVDYFHLWLRYLLGTFIFEPWTGTDGDITLLASALGFTNALSLCFGVVVVYYTFIGGALNTAHSGEVLGKNWSSIWMPIRTAAGLGLIMPASVGGGVLSTAQVLMLWLIITGSNAATFLWNNSIDFLLQQGNSPYSVSSTIGYGPYNDLSKIMVCVDHKIKNQESLRGSNAYSIAYQSSSKARIGSAVVYTNSTFDPNGNISGKVQNTETVTLYGNLSRTDNSGSFNGYLTSVSDVSGVLRGGQLVKEINFDQCGSINLHSREAELEDQDIATQEQARVYEATAIKYQNELADYVDSSFELAKQIGSTSGGNPLKGLNYLTAKLDDDNSEAISEAEDAKSDLEQITRMFSDNASEMVQMSSVEIPEHLGEGWETLEQGSESHMKKGGWASAGLWFIEIGNRQDAINSYHRKLNDNIDANGSPSFCSQSSTQYGAYNQPCLMSHRQYTASMKILGLAYEGTVVGNEYSPDTLNKDDQQNVAPEDELFANCTSVDDCSLSGTDVQHFTQTWAKNLLTFMAQFGTESSVDNTAKVDGSFFSLTGLANPFKTLSGIGHAMNDFALAIYGVSVALAALSDGMSAASEGTNLLNFITGGATSFLGGAAASVIKSVGMTLLPLLFSSLFFGFCLAYVIPLLPVITWINMMVGYLVTVVEATTATPIAIIQMLTPEGQGIVGTRLERAMQLIIVAVMKPSLMIIGLIASISIASIGFTIFSMYFWDASRMVLHGSLFDFFALIAIYTASAVALTRMIVGIMYQLPTHILEWFAAGVGNRSFGENDIAGNLDGSIRDIKAQGHDIKNVLMGRMGGGRGEAGSSAMAPSRPRGRRR